MHFAHICDVQRYHVEDTTAQNICMKSKILVVVMSDVLNKLISKVSIMEVVYFVS